MSLQRRLWTGIMGLLLSLGLVLLMGCSASQPGVKKNITFGVVPTTTGYNALDTAIVTVLQQILSGYNITSTEVGGADSLVRLQNGEIELGPATTTAIFPAYQGEGNFSNKPFKEMRILYYHDYSPMNYIARADAGIKSMKDFEGKSFGPMFRGASTEALAIKAFEILGITPKYLKGGAADIQDAFKNRQIDGLSKANKPPEALFLELKATIPYVFVDFTDEEIAKITKAVPYLAPTKVPLDKYGLAGKVHNTVMFVRGMVATSRMSQADGYAMAKALFSEAGVAQQRKAYPPMADGDLAKLTLETAANPDHPALHAGVVQYLKEKGFQVPKHLIPPEYKG